MCIDVYQADTTPNGPSEDALIYSLLFFRQEAFCDAAWYPCLDAVRLSSLSGRMCKSVLGFHQAQSRELLSAS